MELVNKLVVVLNAVGVDTLSEVKPYISETLTAVKADVTEAKELLKEKAFLAFEHSYKGTLPAIHCRAILKYYGRCQY